MPAPLVYAGGIIAGAALEWAFSARPAHAPTTDMVHDPNSGEFLFIPEEDAEHINRALMDEGGWLDQITERSMQGLDVQEYATPTVLAAAGPENYEIHVAHCVNEVFSDAVEDAEVGMRLVNGEYEIAAQEVHTHIMNSTRDIEMCGVFGDAAEHIATVGATYTHGVIGYVAENYEYGDSLESMGIEMPEYALGN